MERPGCGVTLLRRGPQDLHTWPSPVLSPWAYTLRQHGGRMLAEVHITALQTVTVKVRLP